METAGVTVNGAKLPNTRNNQSNPSHSQTTTQPGQPAGGQSASAPQATPTSANVRINAAGVSTPIVATATPAASKPLCDTSQSNLYCVYEVQPGEVLSTIAEKFGIKNGEVEAWEYLVHSNKPDIVSGSDTLQIGQKIRIPVGNGVIHTVLSAQTLGDIADIYDVESKTIAAVQTNGIDNSNTLRIGQEILIPDPKQFAKPAPPPPTPEPTTAPVRQASGSGSSGSASSSSSSSGSSSSSSGSSGSSTSSAPAAAARSSSGGMIWPTSGRISSYFGPAHPLGIDIDLFNNPNAPIAAAASGTVTFAGGNSCCSYGLYVVVSHSNGLTTLYAHLSSISVSAGQSVSQGALLGYGGRSGYATGNHLHFEVTSGGAHLNPLNYLP